MQIDSNVSFKSDCHLMADHKFEIYSQRLTSSHNVLQGIEDARTLVAMFKLLDGLDGGLLERPIVAATLAEYSGFLLSAFQTEVKNVRTRTYGGR